MAPDLLPSEGVLGPEAVDGRERLGPAFGHVQMNPLRGLSRVDLPMSAA